MACVTCIVYLYMVVMNGLALDTPTKWGTCIHHSCIYKLAFTVMYSDAPAYDNTYTIYCTYSQSGLFWSTPVLMVHSSLSKQHTSTPGVHSQEAALLHSTGEQCYWLYFGALAHSPPLCMSDWQCWRSREYYHSAGIPVVVSRRQWMKLGRFQGLSIEWVGLGNLYEERKMTTQLVLAESYNLYILKPMGIMYAWI